MTVGYNVGVDPKTVPVHPHDVLYRELVNSHDCIVDDIDDSCKIDNMNIDDIDYDDVVEIRAEDIAPSVTWGVSPDQGISIEGTVPTLDDAASGLFVPGGRLRGLAEDERQALERLADLERSVDEDR